MTDRLPFEFPIRWESIDAGLSREAVSRLADRDRALEDYLGTIEGGGRPYATVVVAASDSIAADRARADFVCDGADDHDTLSEALDVLVEGGVGGKVLLLEGTYTLDARLEISADGITFEGMGPDATILEWTGATTAALQRDNGFGGTIRDLTLRGPGKATTLIGLELVTNQTLVTNVRVEGFSTGVKMWGTRNVLSNCFAVDCGVGFYCHDVSSTSTLVACTAMPSQGGGPGCDIGFDIFSNEHVALLGCVADWCGDIGFRISGWYVQMVGCVALTSEGDAGIVVSGSWNTLDDCQVGYSTEHGVKVTGNHNTIEALFLRANNVAAGSFDHVAVAGDSNTIRGCKTRTEDTYDARYGVSIEAGATDNVVVHNDLRTGWATAAYNDAGTGTLTNYDGSANNWNLL